MKMGRSAESDAQLAVRATLAGAAVVRDLYGTSLRRIDTSAGDLATAADLAATAADLAAEKTILDVLRRRAPMTP
ncbi:hypothetical protein [Streptomyces sp. AC555_RSS877]|uniref:hypothetical protein n=1 Tax=Streptomyces sp. AC555_RSS877 TaxID=2823688 RepID=UPI001C27A9B3|nr:hypothetical protein [Streptomyces sp. AC555_RSS877]